MAYPTVSYHLQGAVLALRPIAETTDTQHHPLGTEAIAKDNTYGVAKFLYLKGVAETAAGDVVCYDTKTGTTVRAVQAGATSTGPVAVAMSANLAGFYGWYAVFGSVPVNAATVAADAPLYTTATAGRIDDTVAAGYLITGIISRAATSGDFATCQLNYPSIEALGGSSGANSGDVSLAAFGSTPAAEGASLAAQVLTLQPASATHPGGITAATYTALTGICKITLTPAAEDSNAIVVTGQVTDALGVNIASATQVLVRSLAVTDDKGDISVTAGTSRKIVNPASGENVAWIETTATGGFAVSIANDAAELTLVQASAHGAATAAVALTFAA